MTKEELAASPARYLLENPDKAPVAIICGSRTDWPLLKPATEVLDGYGIKYRTGIVSAHRTPGRLAAFAKGAREAGFRIIIAAAGGAAHLPGMCASECGLPVIGVPMPTTVLHGEDSLLSIVQMPGGIPVATMAIGEPGAKNAGHLAAQMLAIANNDLYYVVLDHKRKLASAVHETVED